MSYLHTASKRIRGKPLEEWFKEVLDKIAENPNIDCYELLKSEI